MKLYVYTCSAPGCDEIYAVTHEPLSCPYCDASFFGEESKIVIEVNNSLFAKDGD